MPRKSKYQVRKFTVTGRGELPLDMLRRDRCWPATELDAAIAEGAGRERTIALCVASYAGNNDAAPNAERWRSFGWSVVEVGDWMSHLSAQD